MSDVTIKIKSLSFKNFKVFENFTLDFTKEDQCKNFICFFGPNGCGKTTVLDVIQMLFYKFEGYEANRIRAMLSKSIRHTEKDKIYDGLYKDSGDFSIKAQMQSSIGDYELELNKNGFLKDHPTEIKPLLTRICYYASFDQNLNSFQLPRVKWPIFKDLFEAVTGFEVEEEKYELNINGQKLEMPTGNHLIKEFVFNFYVHKPNETIIHKECSAGEKKVIKSFATILTKEYSPQIILIDNITMHIESGRHINFVESLKRCFPNSQIFSTTHSYQISKNFADRSQLYDLRVIKMPKEIQNQMWRLYLADEIKNDIFKLNSFINKDLAKTLKESGESIINLLLNDNKLQEKDLTNKTKAFMNNVASGYIDDICDYYKGN